MYQPVQIKSFSLVYEAVKTTTSDEVGWWVGCGKGHLSVSYLRGSLCAEGMGSGMRWVRLVLRGTGTASATSMLV